CAHGSLQATSPDRSTARRARVPPPSDRRGPPPCRARAVLELEERARSALFRIEAELLSEGRELFVDLCIQFITSAWRLVRTRRLDGLRLGESLEPQGQTTLGGRRAELTTCELTDECNELWGTNACLELLNGRAARFQCCSIERRIE